MPPFVRYWLPLIAACGLIFIQSHYPATMEFPNLQYQDKLKHFAAYAVLGILFYRAYASLKHRPKTYTLLAASMLSASLYGLSDEIHQYFVPFRNAEFLDFIADTLGSVCGVLLYHYRVRRTERFNRNIV